MDYLLVLSGEGTYNSIKRTYSIYEIKDSNLRFDLNTEVIFFTTNEEISPTI